MANLVLNVHHTINTMQNEDCHQKNIDKTNNHNGISRQANARLACGFMKNRTKYEVGCKNGKHYVLIFDQCKNQMAVDNKYKNKWRWFLEIEKEYIGDFTTKKDALKMLK